MWRLLELCWWILFLKIISFVFYYVVCFFVLIEGYVGVLYENRYGSVVQICRCKVLGDLYWVYFGVYGFEYWVIFSVSCGGYYQFFVDILDQYVCVGEEYQELQFDGFDNEFFNKIWMKNIGKIVVIFLKDDYFVSGVGLFGRFKVEKVEFYWGYSNGLVGFEYSIDGRRFFVEMQIFFYNLDDFDSF